MPRVKLALRCVRPRLAHAAALAVAIAAHAAADAGAQPAVARPSARVDDATIESGLVFFLNAPQAPEGVVAVGTGHSLELRQVVRAPRVDFLLGRSRRRVATSRAYLTPPGLPFNLPGGSLRNDFAIYALEERPVGARTLDAEAARSVEPGERVQILGVPSDSFRDESSVFGRVLEAGPARIEVDLDVPVDLRNWGGAPVLSTRGERVIGILQAFWPQGSRSRVSVAPIAGVLEALARPLDGGAGRAFDRFAAEAAARPEAPRAAPAPPPPGGEGGAGAAGAHAARPEGPLIEQHAVDGTRVQLDVEYPQDGAVIGQSVCGALVAGRALALQGELRAFDVVLVIDTSRSTIEPTGADIDGDGIVGRSHLGRLGSIFAVGSTDSGDSILAAEVAAARQLLRGLDPRATRVAVVAFAGEPPGGGGGFFSRAPPRPAVTLEPLTHEYRRVELALDDILAAEPSGQTHMAAGVDQATIELAGLRGSLSEPDPRSEKVVLFFTDGQPTLPYGPGFEADNVRAVLRAAARAQRANIRIHSFAIGPDALDGPIATVEMAARTDGYFTPVRHPGDLVDVVEQVSFANLDSVVLRSRTTGEEAKPFRSTADGSWAGLVKLEPGDNEIEVHASAADGAESLRVVHVRHDPDAPGPELPDQLVVQRNRLLEDCLREVKRVRLTAERERAEQVRKQLLVDIEHERAAARERAAAQRKQLELGVEEEEEAGEGAER